MTNRWTAEEVRVLWKTAYLPVLRGQLQGEQLNKASSLRDAEKELPGRTHHTLKDRCYRISEVLDTEGLPWVRGWQPPSNVGQTPNSAGVNAIIRGAILTDAQREFGH